MAVNGKYTAIHKEICLPVVRVRSNNAGGSGTVIYSQEKDGEFSTYVLTNHHVIAGLIKIEKKWDPLLQRDAKRDVRGIPEVHFFNYRWDSRAVGTNAIEANIAAYDEDEDLAILKLRSTTPVSAIAKIYPRDQEKDLRVGMEVYAVGAGLGEPPVITSGFLSQFGREIDNKEFWLNTSPSIYGNSGGALFLESSHELIGVPSRIAVSGSMFASDAITHLSYAIPVTRIYEFFDDQMFRFLYDDKFTEEGEEQARKDKQEKDKLATLSQSEK